ncbi:MAG: hypothetical protein ACK5T8_04940 [Alphaproteobacteria bacterium]
MPPRPLAEQASLLTALCALADLLLALGGVATRIMLGHKDPPSKA